MSYNGARNHNWNYRHYRHNGNSSSTTMQSNIDARVQLIDGLHWSTCWKVQHVCRCRRFRLSMLQQLILNVNRADRCKWNLLHARDLIRSILVGVGNVWSVAKLSSFPELSLGNTDCREHDK
uniref:Uncharacterized protein n=1 Tax=Anopheles culicifacies TaxID=139723 RepID=A0A182MT96_9DIPT